MGHGPLINQTYEVIRGPTEATLRVSARAETESSQHSEVPGGTERSEVSEAQGLAKTEGRVLNAGVGAAVF